ncbi:unnamed protein product [Scytosiphon promiscuus]
MSSFFSCLGFAVFPTPRRNAQSRAQNELACRMLVQNSRLRGEGGRLAVARHYKKHLAHRRSFAGPRAAAKTTLFQPLFIFAFFYIAAAPCIFSSCRVARLRERLCWAGRVRVRLAALRKGTPCGVARHGAFLRGEAPPDAFARKTQAVAP